MIKAAIEKLVSLKDNQTYEINGQTYSDNPLLLVEAPKYRPKEKEVNSLNAIVAMIGVELGRVNTPLFVRVADERTVEVFTTYGRQFERDILYVAKADTQAGPFGWMEYDEAMIALRSCFVENEDVRYIIDLLSKITDENSVSTEDNGFTQTVEARKGIAIRENVCIKPIVRLIPYRTFLEVEQPEGEFLLRLREGGKVRFFEADGGMWKLKAKKTIKKHLSEELQEFIDDESVIVIM